MNNLEMLFEPNRQSITARVVDLIHLWGNLYAAEVSFEQTIYIAVFETKTHPKEKKLTFTLSKQFLTTI